MTASTGVDEARRALVMHDHQVTIDLIALTLNHGLFAIRAVHDLAEVETAIAEWGPHIAVVDMDHDHGDGLVQYLAEQARLSGRHIPAIGLTRRGDLKTKLRAFDIGVDDILTTPFSPEELVARCAVSVRRSSGLDQVIVPTLTLGEMVVDIVNREVRAGQSVVHLSGTEQSLLYLLASRGGQVVTREQILDAIWGTDFVAESNVVDRHIRSLRSKLQDDYRSPRFIATIPGKGYRFIPTFTNKGWDAEQAT